MKKLSSILVLLLLFSCKKESRFDLEKDLFQFSQKMENGDTLQLNVNHSACMFSGFEKYTFTKQDDTLFLEICSKISSFQPQKGTSIKGIYSVKPNDSLSFENFFKYLKKENKPKRDHSSPLVTVQYLNENQVQFFYDEDLRDKFQKLDRLFLIREKIYPNNKFFEVLEPPPPRK